MPCIPEYHRDRMHWLACILKTTSSADLLTVGCSKVVVFVITNDTPASFYRQGKHWPLLVLFLLQALFLPLFMLEFPALVHTFI